MTEIKYQESALIDKIEAISIINDYFTLIDKPNLAIKHRKKFRDELSRQIALVKRFPQMHQVRTDWYFSDRSLRQYRSFTAHWFTVFYSYEEPVVSIWFIKPSVSDLSVISFPKS